MNKGEIENNENMNEKMLKQLEDIIEQSRAKNEALKKILKGLEKISEENKNKKL